MSSAPKKHIEDFSAPCCVGCIRISSSADSERADCAHGERLREPRWAKWHHRGHLIAESQCAFVGLSVPSSRVGNLRGAEEMSEFNVDFETWNTFVQHYPVMLVLARWFCSLLQPYM